MNNKKEMSQLQRQLLGGGGGITLFTQQEFDKALLETAQTITAVASETAKGAVLTEREACAMIAEQIAQEMENEGEGSTGYIGYLIDCAERIRNRIPSQREEIRNGFLKED